MNTAILLRVNTMSARLVDVDLPLAKLEDEIQAIEDQLDREIQALIDERRGK